MNSQYPGGVAGHAFISYVREDRKRVDRLQAILERAGIKVWRDTGDIWPGRDWRFEIHRAITTDSLAFLACFSENTERRVTSYQNEELLLAVEQMRLRVPGQPWLIPVRFTECALPPFDLGGGRRLDSLQYVDLFDGSWELGIPRLVGAVLSTLHGRSRWTGAAPVGDWGYQSVQGGSAAAPASQDQDRRVPVEAEPSLHTRPGGERLPSTRKSTSIPETSRRTWDTGHGPLESTASGLRHFEDHLSLIDPDLIDDIGGECVFVYGPRSLGNGGKLTLQEWQAKEYSKVRVGDPLYRYSQSRWDSRSFQGRASASGVLCRIRVREGDEFDALCQLAEIKRLTMETLDSEWLRQPAGWSISELMARANEHRTLGHLFDYMKILEYIGRNHPPAEILQLIGSLQVTGLSGSAQFVGKIARTRFGKSFTTSI